MNASVSQRLSILAVDDEPLILINTAAVLEDMGHQVFEAQSGPEALELARKNPDLDLLITDQSMPSMSGMELIDCMAKEWPGLPVILATGYSQIPDGAQQGIVLLRKPYTGQDLLQAIGQALNPDGAPSGL